MTSTNVSTPSSLTGFLAPGGQLPVHKDGVGDSGSGGSNGSGSGGSNGIGGGGVAVTGKPSIVKVTLAPPGHQPQHQRPSEDELLHSPHAATKYSKNSANNHQQAYQFPTRSTDSFQSTPFKTSSSNDWYYANYNKTNVEPFVSKTSAAVAAAGSRGQSGNSAPKVTPATIVMAAALLIR